VFKKERKEAEKNLEKRRVPNLDTSLRLIANENSKQKREKIEIEEKAARKNFLNRDIENRQKN